MRFTFARFKIIGGRTSVWMCSFLLSISFLLALCPSQARADDQPGPLVIPHLTQPFVIDGNIDEWSSAVGVPLLTKSQVSSSVEPHIWKGISDAGMVVLCAWNSQGLCLSAIVSDDHVMNNRNPADYWEQDCVEFMVDGRTGTDFASKSYTKGAYQILVSPPINGKPAEATVNPRDGKIDGLKVSGKDTPTGYTIELLIPWSAFPGFEPKPGANFGLHFGLDDADSGEELIDQPLQMMWRHGYRVWERPGNIAKWQLGETCSANDSASANACADIDLPTKLDDHENNIDFQVLAAQPLASAATSARLDASTEDGESVTIGTVKFDPIADPFKGVLFAKIHCTPNSLPAGDITITATFLNDGKAITSTSRKTFNSNFDSVINDSLRRIGNANVGELAQRSPFKAAQYLSAAACVERIKRKTSRANMHLAGESTREIRARLDLLETGKKSTAGTYDLLTLGADPQSQVVVQYTEDYYQDMDYYDYYDDYASVGFFWGSAPLLFATVHELDQESWAEEYVVPDPDNSWDWPLKGPSDPGAPKNFRARLIEQPYRSAFQLKDFSPEKHVALVMPNENYATVIDIDRLKYASPAEAVVMLPDCTDSVRTTVTRWAAEKKLNIVDEDAAAQMTNVLVAGDIRSATLWGKTGLTGDNIEIIRDRFKGMDVLYGRRIINVRNPSKAATEEAVRLILRGTPVSPNEVDAIRADLVDSLAPANLTLAAQNDLCFGDVHSQTFFSTGTPSPVERALRSISAFEDYDVISDENTIEGAQLATHLLNVHGFSYPLIVGEEIATPWVHTNAFPLKHPIAPKKTLEEMTSAAHTQNAVIQFDNPGTPMSDFQTTQLPKGLAGTKLDAWEHVPSDYDAWKKAGKLPVITGGSGTVDETCGYELTVISGEGCDGQKLAQSIRDGQTALISAREDYYLYGPDAITNAVWSALKEAKTMKEDTARMLSKTLKNTDLVGLIKSSPLPPTEGSALRMRW